MAKKPREQQKTDADTRPARIDEARERLTRERGAAVARLRALRVSPEFDEQAPPGGNESTLEEGDAAQASERRDMSFTTRERVARRINELTAALERIERGEYGRCGVCGNDIEPERLRAIPEAATCLRCQERLERTGTPEQAA
jgi:RNA polymerase-binding transcription factor DksA